MLFRKSDPFLSYVGRKPRPDEDTMDIEPIPRDENGNLVFKRIKPSEEDSAR